MSVLQPRHLRIFLSSPGDVADERNIALKVLENLPYDSLLRNKVTIQIVAWDKKGAGVPMLATMTPQEAINQGLPTPSQCDIVIVIFWSRMGTPLPPEYTKPDGSPYFSGTEWEYLDALMAAQASTERPSRPQVVVYRRTETPKIALDDPEHDSKREQYNRVKAFFNAFINPDGSIRQGYNEYKTPDEFREQLETHLKFLVGRLIETAARPADRAGQPAPESELPDWPGSPFPGLRAFTDADAPIYFGRGHEADGLVALLANGQRFVTVVGASGSGKSSLVWAGLIPRLAGNAIEGSKDWLWVRFTPGQLGDDPFLPLADAVLKQFPNVRKDWTRPRDLAEALARNAEALDKLAALIFEDADPWVELLLFVDQFEELFTLAAPGLRGPFVNLLDHATRHPRLRVTLTMRADFYHRCLEYPELTGLLQNTGSYPLAAPKAGALLEMITRPAARAGLTFEDGLPQRILDDTGTESGSLALMAYALEELYRAAQQTGSNQLTHAAYDQMGGVEKAIGTRATEVYGKLPPEIQAALPDVFRELVQVDERGVATRQRTPFERVTGGENTPAAALVAALIDARLLVSNRVEGGERVIEVAHEALLRNWPALAQWIEENQEDIRLLQSLHVAAAEWERRGRDPDFLWQWKRLEVVQEMIARLKPSLSDAERAFARSAQDDLKVLRDTQAAAAEWERRGRDPDFLWDDRRLEAVHAVFERLRPDLDPVTKAFIRFELERLAQELQDPATTHQRRASISERFAAIGDPRYGVGLGDDGPAETHWCAVNREDGATFHIAKYPVTYMQYRAFLKAEDGYTNPQWWDGLTHQARPGTQFRQIDNHPAENVSWYDATAYCRWLSAKRGYEIRLPTQDEWLLAAASADPKLANLLDSGLKRTIAVGMYPAAACGAMDMLGNVAEWCADQIARGGSWGSSGADVFDYNPIMRSGHIGFRIATSARPDVTSKEVSTKGFSGDYQFWTSGRLDRRD